MYTNILCAKIYNVRFFVSIAAKQISPYNIGYVVESYKHATRDPFSYLFFDFKQSTPEIIRLRSNIYPDEFPMTVYNCEKYIK